MGISFKDQAELNQTFFRFKKLADKKSAIYDEDFQALVSDTRNQTQKEKYSLIIMQADSCTDFTPTTKHTLSVDRKEE